MEHIAHLVIIFSPLSALVGQSPRRKGFAQQQHIPRPPRSGGGVSLGNMLFLFGWPLDRGPWPPISPWNGGPHQGPPLPQFVNTQLPPLCACCEHRIAHRARGLPWDSQGITSHRMFQRAPADPEGDARDVVPVPTTGEARCAGVGPSGPFLLSTKGRWNKQEEGIQRIPSQSPRAPPCPLLGGGGLSPKGRSPLGETPDIMPNMFFCSRLMAIARRGDSKNSSFSQKLSYKLSQTGLRH